MEQSPTYDYYCPDMYAEYVEEFVEHDLDDYVRQIRVPVLFEGAKGDPASVGYDTQWDKHMDSSTPFEVVTAQIVNAGTGGEAAHLHVAMHWRRHVLTVRRFLERLKPGLDFS